MELKIGWPASRAGRGLTMFAVYTVPGLAAGVSDIRAWPLWADVLGGVFVIGLVALVLRGKATEDVLPLWASWLRVLAGLAALALTVTMYVGARVIVLDVWGRPETVRVDSVDASYSKPRAARGRSQQVPKIRRTYCYHLSRADGSPVFGTICRDYRDYTLGGQADVLLEPTGLVAPESPAAVAGAPLRRNIALGALAVIVLFALSPGASTLEKTHPDARRPRGPRVRPVMTRQATTRQSKPRRPRRR